MASKVVQHAGSSAIAVGVTGYLPLRLAITNRQFRCEYGWSFSWRRQSATPPLVCFSLSGPNWGLRGVMVFLEEGYPMELPLRHQTPSAIPNADSELAKTRHRDGLSCDTPSAYVYDANGHKRWCIDCGTQLGEQAYRPDGADVPHWALGAFIVGLTVLLLLVGIAMALGGHGTNSQDTGGIGGGVRATPTTYGPPDGNVRPGSGSLPRPTPLPAPMVSSSHAG